MYEFTNLKRLSEDPRRIPRVWDFFACKFNRWYHRTFLESDGVAVMEEDWDNLVILDACRYDAFAEKCTIDGRLEKRISRGSHSLEFIEENFAGQELHDTVYVTANPQFERIEQEGIFHAVEQLLFTDWDETLRTVPPERMAEATLKAREKYPDKRIIAHFMQPHVPFIGDVGKELTQRGLTGEEAEVDDLDPSRDSDEPNIWFKARFLLDDVTQEMLRRGYRENIDIALGTVKEMLEGLRGKTVLTADHGELLGEQIGPIPAREFAHHQGLRVPELVEIPWFIVEGDERVEVTAGRPVESADERTNDSTVESRLRALGYR